jgi:ubiquinone/menaquinone biosynthesis C-methylase UbiE
MKTQQTYIPALRYRFLTPLYDFVLRRLMQEERFKRILVQEASIFPGQHVLDLGCGTATLTVMIKQTNPQASVTGLDGDVQVLKIGREKAKKANVELVLD